MSHKQNIRRVQRELAIKYRDARTRVNQSGDEAKTVMDEYRVDFERALDFVVVDRGLVERQLTWRTRYTGEGACERCGGPNVWPVDKKGDFDEFEAKYCRACVAEDETVDCVICGRLYLAEDGDDDMCPDCQSDFWYKVNKDD